MYNVAAGQTVIRQGGKPECLFEIISGTLKLSQVTEDGRQIIVGFPSSGETVGLTGGEENHYAAETLTMTRLRPVRWKTFYEQLLQSRPAREKLLRWFDAQNKMLQDHIAVLSLQSPMSKLAAFLLKQISQRSKNTGDDEVIIDLSMTQRDIATYLAIAPETCSRTMKKFRDDGIIEAMGRSGEGKLVKIRNQERLNEAANGPFL
ncbi:Crp/Fnr family transcriptional regulator [Sphingorhabdus sp. M41]|uniref:Crp/Fnr family transcriptional regulator n=1 Tax=Sphingorhabdus sp. M41 TaxID=1806885 RepID=UPI0018D2C84F|nr:Crp/Fnr family transcriptional regulator [Sphingorhabdus sp. M41]